MSSRMTMTATRSTRSPSKCSGTALLSVANEQQAALMRTAFSTVVRESQDLACGVFDIARQHGRPVGDRHARPHQRDGDRRPPLPDGVPARDAVARRRADHQRPVDDRRPAQRHHHPDAGLRRRAACVAFFANTCHVADIGGRILSAEAREVYEEGLYIPIMKLFDAGERNEELFKIIRGNVRTAGRGRGRPVRDDHLQRRRRRAAAGVHGRVRAGQHRAARGRDHRALRAGDCARRSRELPDGVYENELWSDGFEEPIVLKATVTVDGDELTVDHTGSLAAEPLRHQRGPELHPRLHHLRHQGRDLPRGAAQRGRVPPGPRHARPRARSSTPQHPAPVAARHLIGHFLPSLIFGALVDAMPDRLHGRRRRADLGHRLPRRASAAAEPFNLTHLPVRRHRRAADQGRPEQHRLPERRGRRAGRGDREPDGAGAGAPRDPAGLGRAGHVPRRLRAVHHVRRRSGLPWSMAGMCDRPKFPAQGMLGGSAGLPAALR